MNVTQIVQCEILGAARRYTYGWVFDPLDGGQPLLVGDKVEIPPNAVQEEGAAATVVALGSDYTGPMKSIVRRIDERVKGGGDLGKAGGPEDDLWAGWETGQY